MLARLPEQAALPQAVAEEISAAAEDDPARQALQRGLFKIVKTPPIPDTILAWDLGKGESAVLAYALAHWGSIAILDDAAARRCARSLSVPVTGTLTVVILAKQFGLIESAAQVLTALRGADFRLEDDLIRDVLSRTVGEKWRVKK